MPFGVLCGERRLGEPLGLSLKDGTIRAEGDLDFRGTLGVDRDAPVGFKEIRLAFDLSFDGEVSAPSLDQLCEKSPIFRAFIVESRSFLSHRQFEFNGRSHDPRIGISAKSGFVEPPAEVGG